MLDSNCCIFAEAVGHSHGPYKIRLGVPMENIVVGGILPLDPVNGLGSQFAAVNECIAQLGAKRWEVAALRAM
ncbi:hypothetical protein AK812_SmicGene45894, partial [Symbiodinium microadriaticum]